MSKLTGNEIIDAILASPESGEIIPQSSSDGVLRSSSANGESGHAVTLGFPSDGDTWLKVLDRKNHSNQPTGDQRLSDAAREGVDVLIETGMTPRQLDVAWAECRTMLLGAEVAEASLARENAQLREQRDELLAALKAIVAPGGGFYCNLTVQDKARSAIASVEAAS